MSMAQAHDVACTKCKFFDDHIAQPRADNGLCRFNPPVTQPSAEAHGLWCRPATGAGISAPTRSPPAPPTDHRSPRKLTGGGNRGISAMAPFYGRRLQHPSNQGRILSHAMADALAPTGILRAGINIQNGFMVSGRDEAGDPVGLRPGLLADAQTLPGARLLDGHFTTVQQAIGTRRVNTAWVEFLSAFVEEAKRSGLVERFIGKHRVQGLSVAPLQDIG